MHITHRQTHKEVLHTMIMDSIRPPYNHGNNLFKLRIYSAVSTPDPLKKLVLCTSRAL